ncbi:hypothetical protein [Dokdonella sp.]|uniref:hypothetical protein n=1 Tax=Dokdonella sp. TaxID=2291710 RepID=UPI003C433F75
MTRSMFRLLALIAFAAHSSASAAEFFGPLPYLSAESTPSGFASGPTFIETFEDRSLDRRISASASSIQPPGSITDSVDADDGAIDGSGTGGTSLFGSSIRIDFLPPFPRYAGMVWTDGAPSAVTFEAFGPSGQSLGVVGPVNLGDNSISGTTAEDRFFGVRDAGGVSAIRFTSTAVMEIDHIQFESIVEPAIMSTIDDGNLALLLENPGGGLPVTAQQTFALPAASAPHGLSYLGGRSALFADLLQPTLYRSTLANPGSVSNIGLTGRTSANGSLAVDPNGRYALSIGQSAAGAAEAVVVDFGVSPPIVTAISPALRILSFVTAAIDFAPDRRAFVCHTSGVSVLSPPYTTVDFTIPFPSIVQSPSMCRLTPDGNRLFVTRVMSETVATTNAVRTTTAPYSAASSFVEIPTPADVQGLGPMAVSPDGQSLIVGQQFLFPPAFAGTRARAFLLRAPFDGSTDFLEIALPPEVVGLNCTDSGSPDQCPGFEHIEVSANGDLAILTGNSAAAVSGAADRVPAVFLVNPFSDSLQSSLAVPIGINLIDMGRGAGGVRFQPDRIFVDGFGR